ncbi:MAG: response regulator, partial [Bacillota bacterium]
MIQILIVEDEYWIRKGIIRAIQWDRLSMELAGEAQNGAEAVKLLDRQPVDIIVMDMRMPIMNGEELLKHLRGTGYRGGLIVLSEHSDYGFMHQAILSQADEYMLKPLDEKELNDALMRIRDRLLIQSSSGEPVSRILDALISNAPMPKPPPSPFHCVIAALWAGNLQDVPFRQNDVLNANYYWRKLDRHTGILICFDFADAHSLRKNLETAVQNWEDASKAPVLLGLSQAYAKMPPQDAYAKAQQALQYLHAASPVVSYDETAALSLPPPMTLIQAPLLEKLLASAEFGQTEAIARQ